VAPARHLPRGLCLGLAAFTEGERWTGGFTGCGAFMVVAFFGFSTIGLAIGVALYIGAAGAIRDTNRDTKPKTLGFLRGVFALVRQRQAIDAF